MSHNNSTVSTHWPAYHRLWVVVAIILLILLLLLWLLGYGPGGKKCQVAPTIVEKVVEKEVVVEKVFDNPKLVNRVASLEKETIQIPALLAKIKALEAEKQQEEQQLTVLKSKLGELAVVKKQLPELKEKVSLLEAQKRQATGLAERLQKLKDEKDKLIKALQDKIQSLENTPPKVIEKIIRVPVAPNAPVMPVMTPPSAPARPNTPASSMPAAPVQLMDARKPDTAKLYFKVGSAEFPADPKLSLANIIAYLHRNKSADVEISGFHDASGNQIKNKELSLQRAQEVVKLLLAAGISSDRIKIAEPQQTVGTGKPEEARRVEVRILP